MGYLFKKFTVRNWISVFVIVVLTVVQVYFTMAVVACVNELMAVVQRGEERQVDVLDVVGGPGDEGFGGESGHVGEGERVDLLIQLGAGPRDDGARGGGGDDGDHRLRSGEQQGGEDHPEAVFPDFINNSALNNAHELIDAGNDGHREVNLHDGE